MGDGSGTPVAAGLIIGIAFVILLAFASSPLTARDDDASAIENIVLQVDFTAPLYPDYDRVKVYIFPRDVGSNVTADDLDWELGLKAGVTRASSYSGNFGASKLGIYNTNGTIVVPDGTDFYISPELKRSDGSQVGVEDIHEQHRFGNGTKVGDILLKPEGAGQTAELVPAITFVVAEPDIADVDAKIELVRDSINDPKLVKVTIPEGASIASSGTTYEPQSIKVVIGYNNTVRWVNEDSTYHFIEADNNTDLDFYRKTTYANPDASRRNLMGTGESFVYTFTNEGEIGYHGMPHLRGTVVVLPPLEKDKDQSITITGEVVCLPHKKFASNGGMFVETTECAIGFYGKDDGKYYGFNSLFFNEKHNWLFSAQGSGELFNVTGVVRPAGDDFKLYDIAGVIEITSAGRADGTTSIYEVYGRHYKQLSEIVHEISKRTGGGYSMGIDEGCDDLNQGSKDDEKSCILIALDKDLPELSSRIPRDVEGYKVYVRILENS